MIRKLSAFLAGALLCTLAFGQSVPNGGPVVTGQIWTAAQWNNAWMSKFDVTGGTLTAPTLNNPTITGGVQSAPAISNPTVTTGTFGSPAFTGTPTLNGTAFATSATVDATNASNISSGTLSISRLNLAGSPTWTGPNTFSAGLSATTGAFSSALTFAGVQVPTYPQTAAEIAASVTPTTFTFAAGNVLRYGADLTGATDVSASFIKAVSSNSHVVIPPGQYLLSGTATVALANVEIECQGAPANANTPPAYGSTGATIRLTSTSVQPFTVGAGVRIRNCNFFWPNQAGTTSSPIAYPPLFTEPSGGQLSNFDLVNDRMINAYDVIGATSASDAMGNISLTDTYGYAIRYWLSLANVPETVTVKGMSADWSLYQNVANASPNYFLVKWTAANGAFLHVFGNGNGSTTSSTVEVAGLVYDGAVFAYNKFVWVDSTGALGESAFHGIVDAVPHVLEVDSGGCAGDIQMDGLYFSYQWNPPSGGIGGADNATAFSIATPASGFNCTTTNIDIGGHVSSAQGDVLDLSGSFVGHVSLHLHGGGIYARSTTAGTYFFANVNSPTTILEASGNTVQPLTASSSSRGFDIQACGGCTIDGNTFNGVFNPIAVASAGIPLAANGNLSEGSPTGSNAVLGTGTFSHAAMLPGANTWDLIQPPTVTSCGASASVNGGSTDQSGSITIGTGAVASCTLMFNQAYGIGPKCMSTASVGASWTGAVSTTTAIFNFPSTSGGSIWYSCAP